MYRSICMLCALLFFVVYCVHVKFTLQYNGGNKDVYINTLVVLRTQTVRNLTSVLYK